MAMQLWPLLHQVRPKLNCSLYCSYRIPYIHVAGVAAINIGGQTIHAFAGIGIGKGDKDQLVKRAVLSSSSFDRWTRTKVLVVDEVSMLPRDLLEILNEIAQKVKKNALPFGGIQIIAVGDFLQLPPVSIGTDKFCFQSAVWEQADLHCSQIFLKDIIRQKDMQFINILNEVRVGKLSSDSMPLLDACVVTKKPLPTDGIIPTKLYCYNKDVDRENLNKLASLPGETLEITAVDMWKGVKPNANQKKSLLDTAEKAIPEKINLKVGAQVMLRRNRNTGVDDIGPAGDKQKVLGLVNGSRGIVTGFVKSAVDDVLVPTVRFDNGKTIVIGKVEYVVTSPDGDCAIIRSQVPLKLAW